MSLPRWLAALNKRTFNKREIRKGDRPVLTHVGRATGTTYRVPLDAHRTTSGYVFIPLYGAHSDWVRNIMASGSAQLRVEGAQYDLDAPRLVTAEEAASSLPHGTNAPAGFTRVEQLLQMDLAA